MPEVRGDNATRWQMVGYLVLLWVVTLLPYAMRFAGPVYEVAAFVLGATFVWIAALFVGIGTIAGASGSRLIQYAILGAIAGTAGQLITVHSYVESTLRPARAAIARAAPTRCGRDS